MPKEERSIMRVLLANPRGFCAGVNMATEALEEAIVRFGVPLYVFHEIVHNTWVVEGFRRQGVIFVHDLAEIPPGSRVLFSAHGVSPAVRVEAKKRNLKTIDATCPLVEKVHREVLRYAEKGYRILLIGHAGHDEVVGVMGEAPECIQLITREEDVDRLSFPGDPPLAYLMQTTLSVTEAGKIVARLRSRFPRIVAPRSGDICFATQNRQEAVRRLSVEADLVLVVGSRSSSNSRRLAELAAERGTPAHLIDGPDDIDPAWLFEEQTVLLTAGASAPEKVVDACIGLLRWHFSVEVQERIVCEESVRFVLPKELRK
jgi:4-hydroxy-3-methylbut-2-enyl diphosphate reductase